MKKTLLTVATAAVAVTCLAWAQPPQGAKETVVIKETAAPAAKPPAERLPTPGAAPKPKVSRDPFVPGGAPAETAGPPPIAAPTDKKGPEKGPDDGSKTIPPPGDAAPVIVAPEVTVKGILLSAKGNRAIVVSPNTTFIVKQGDKLGDYKVASITAKKVTFSFKDKKFPIKIDDEFGAMKK
ncbi:hypothetical protein IV102_00130 [bacterium]|nr:hypothetical protein [bacterium]